MVSARRSHARWTALIISIALVASAIITFTLVRITAPAGEGPDIATTGTTLTATSAGSSSAASDQQPTTARTSPSSAPSSTVTSSAAESSVPTSRSTSRSGTSTAAPTTETSVLNGSGVVLPAAWAGSAKVTVRVLGDCSTSTPSVYGDVTANLALDLTRNELASSTVATTAPKPPNAPTLTLGVGTDQLPKLTVYSSAIDETGAFQRYWNITLTPDGNRTHVTGTLTDAASDGNNPNFLADSETSLQPCESAGTVSLPRPLATGSTVTGWVTTTRAQLTLRASTTDGKRAVTVRFTGHRDR